MFKDYSKLDFHNFVAKNLFWYFRVHVEILISLDWIKKKELIYNSSTLVFYYWNVTLRNLWVIVLNTRSWREK